MWIYEGKEFEPEDGVLEQYQGFVYRLTELNTGKKYIGKKFFWKPKVLPVTKTRKRRKRTRVQSDWRDYYGSSEQVKTLVEEGQTFHREILRLCHTKGECSYWELYEQMINHVLLKEEYYNEFVGAKIHSKHLKKVEKNT